MGTTRSGHAKQAFASIGICLLALTGIYYAWSSEVASATRLHGEKRIAIQASSGRVEIVGTPSPDVRVTIENVSAESARTARIKIDRNRNPVLVEIDDLPQSATAFVEVPSIASLAVSMTAGELQISGVDGDKMCLLRSGRMAIDVGEPEAYRSIRGFVLAGDLQARVFNSDKGGLWRRMSWRGPGKTLLDAHVDTGLLIFQ